MTDGPTGGGRTHSALFLHQFFSHWRGGEGSRQSRTSQNLTMIFSSSYATAVLAAVRISQQFVLVLSREAIGPELRTVGDKLFSENESLEPSGLVWLPDKLLLAGVSDEGAVFLFNPDDDDEYYVDEKVSGLPDDLDLGDYEGVTVDTYLIESALEPNHLYIANEDPPTLLKVKYSLPDDSDDHDLDVEYVDHVELGAYLSRTCSSCR